MPFKGIDMTGQKIGYLTVIRRDLNKHSTGATWWICKCERCGKENFSIDGRKLRGKNPQQSCGCMRGQTKSIDWTGKKQGRLNIIKCIGSDKSRHKLWEYICDCGKTGVISSHSLTAGTQSCGCLNKERTYESNKANLKGKHFGKLTVIEETKKRNYRGNIVWKCKCECGNECFASTTILMNGDKKSCGCIKKSYQEECIEELLKQNNISFEKEKRFENCKDIYPLPFDFYVNQFYIIEYDGEQHFKSISSWGGEEELKTRQKHDKIKNQWCIDNNIPIIRIPYTIKEIKIEDLLLETSKYIYKGE